MNPNRGEIWLADLDPRRGTEPGKTRPVLVIQAQALNEAGHPSTLVIPLTTSPAESAEPLRVHVARSGKLRHESELLIDQLHAIDNRRLVSGPLVRLSAQLMRRVGLAILEVLDLVE